MWKHLKHQNIVYLIGVTQEPLQFVSEWMPNGNLTEYVKKTVAADRMGLVSPPCNHWFINTNHRQVT